MQARWFLPTGTRIAVKWLSPLLLLLLSLCCSSPRQLAEQSVDPGTKSASTPAIVAPQIVPSTQSLPAPAILGVNYIGTIGRPGQGAGQFLQPVGLALDHRSLLYVADAGNNRVQVIDTEGNFIAEFGNRGWRVGEFDRPTDVAVNFHRTEILYVVDTGNNRVQYCRMIDQIFQTLVGNLADYAVEDVSENVEIELDAPGGIAISRNREVYVVDTGNNRFIKFNAEGVPVLAFGSFGSASEQFRHPTDLVVDTRGNVYIVDSGNNRVKKYDFSGNLSAMWGEEQFREPSHIALDRWNYLYVTDRGARKVKLFTLDGQALMEFGDETLVEPTGIAISKDGRIFITDLGANNIKVFEVIYRPNP